MNAKQYGDLTALTGADNALLPPEMERLESHLELTAKSLPVFETAGIKKVVSGPITHTPDGNFLLGPAPWAEELLDVLRSKHWYYSGSRLRQISCPMDGSWTN